MTRLVAFWTSQHHGQLLVYRQQITQVRPNKTRRTYVRNTFTSRTCGAGDSFTPVFLVCAKLDRKRLALASQRHWQLMAEADADILFRF